MRTDGFPERLATLRKQRGLTVKALADAAGVHVTQMRRYEGGTSQPTLDVLRRMAITLRVSADALLFDEKERGPTDTLRFQFEAASRLDVAELEVVKSVLEGILLKHEARKLMHAGGAAPSQSGGRPGKR